MDTIHLPPDFKEFIQRINSAEVEYLIVGGYAVGFHGAPRFTADIDIWLNYSTDNAARIGRALAEFGFREPDITSGRFLKPDSVFRIGHPPLQIDLLPEITGCSFPDCFARRQVLIRDGVELSIIGVDDLRINKLAAGRQKVLGDLESLS